MTENPSTSSRTRHIDIRYHYVRELKEKSEINISFVPSAKQYADMFTKNVSSDIYEDHVRKFLYKKSDVWASVSKID